MSIVYGKALKGGTLSKQADLLDRAINDLNSKIKGVSASSLAVYEDDASLNVVASVDVPEKKASEDAKKGGK